MIVIIIPRIPLTVSAIHAWSHGHGYCQQERILRQ